MADGRVFFYDSSLRTGGLPEGVELSTADKLTISQVLDDLGIDYVEAGQPGIGPQEDALFAEASKFAHARLVAFTRLQSPGGSAAGDPGLTRARASGARTVCLYGMGSVAQARAELGAEPREQIDMIAESVSLVDGWADETMFLCEHFFDGFKENPKYALECLATAYIHGARWVVLADSNGGTLPHEISATVTEVAKALPASHIGIRCLNDSDSAVAGTLAAVRAGARQVQGTFNGLGPRCGNANLASLIPNLLLKMGFEAAVAEDGLAHLADISRRIDARLNRQSEPRAPFVGAEAFRHGAGRGAAEAAVRQEHIDPQAVGNRRRAPAEGVLDMDGLLRRLHALGIEAEAEDAASRNLLEVLRESDTRGLSYNGAEASFELLARGHFGKLPNYFTLDGFRVIDERRIDARGDLKTLSEASVRVQVGDNRHMMVAEGAGPVHVLDVALRKALGDAYPSLEALRLIDYKVRILNSDGGTQAHIRVVIDSTDGSAVWSTVGVSDNVIDASYSALYDGIVYKLLRDDLSRASAGSG
jgi:2-isopropylmalate synthase